MEQTLESIILTIVPSSQTVPLSIVNAAQQKIGTGRELNEDLRPCIPTGLRTPRRDQRQNSRREEVQGGAVPCSEIQRRKGRWSMPTGEPK